MNRLKLSEILDMAADKSNPETVDLTPLSYCLIVHTLTLLKDNLWFFVDAGDLESEAVDQALDDMLP